MFDTCCVQDMKFKFEMAQASICEFFWRISEGLASSKTHLNQFESWIWRHSDMDSIVLQPELQQEIA